MVTATPRVSTVTGKPTHHGGQSGDPGLERFCNTDTFGIQAVFPTTASASRSHLPNSGPPAFINFSFSKSGHWCKKLKRLTVKMCNGHINFYAQFRKSEMQPSKTLWFFFWLFEACRSLFLQSGTVAVKHKWQESQVQTMESWPRSIPPRPSACFCCPGMTYREGGFLEA